MAKAKVKKGGVKQLSTGSKGGVKRPGGVKRGGTSTGVQKAKNKAYKKKITKARETADKSVLLGGGPTGRRKKNQHWSKAGKNRKDPKKRLEDIKQSAIEKAKAKYGKNKGTSKPASVDISKYTKPKATDAQYHTKKNKKATKSKGGSGSKYKNKFEDNYPGLRNLRDNIIL